MEASHRERRFQVEDSKRCLKEAISVRGGQTLQNELQLAEQLARQREEQQKREDEQRAFDETLERLNREQEPGRR